MYSKCLINIIVMNKIVIQVVIKCLINIIVMNKIVIQVVICILIAFFITVKPTSNTKARLGYLLHSFFAGFMCTVK